MIIIFPFLFSWVGKKGSREEKEMRRKAHVKIMVELEQLRTDDDPPHFFYEEKQKPWNDDLNNDRG